MNELRRKRLEELKNKSKVKAQEIDWENNELLQECIEFTKGKILDREISKQIESNIQSKFPFSIGSIDFCQISNSNELDLKYNSD